MRLSDGLERGNGNGHDVCRGYNKKTSSLFRLQSLCLLDVTVFLHRHSN
jgi:hypothetical protein